MQTAITRTSGPGRVLLEVDSGEAAIPLVEQLAPDVVLMDCRMPGAGGVAATREIVKRWSEVAVVAHTAYADETYVREMVAAGARPGCRPRSPARSWRICASCTRPP